AVVNGTAWLTASYSARGRPVTRPPRGMAVPVDVSGADPAGYAAVAAPGQRRRSRGRGRGPRRSARPPAGGAAPWAGGRRGCGAGGGGGGPGGGGGLRRGVRPRGVPRYLLLSVRPGSVARAVARRVRAVVPAGTPVRIRLPGQAAWLREGRRGAAADAGEGLFR